MKSSNVNKQLTVYTSPEPQKMKFLYFYSMKKSAEKSNLKISYYTRGHMGTIFHYYLIKNICKCQNSATKHLVDAHNRIGGSGNSEQN